MNVSHETKYMRFHRQLHEAGLRINPVALKCADKDYNIMLSLVRASSKVGE